MTCKSSPPKHCKGCPSHWKHGLRDGKHNNWCCKFGKPALEAEAHCRNTNSKPKCKEM